MHVRFYGPDAERNGDLVELPEEEAQHLTRVLRLKVGAAVRVFNGRGGEFDAVVHALGKSSVKRSVKSSGKSGGKIGARVRIGAARAAAAEARVAVTLVQAVLKGDSMDEVVRDAVMMGVAAIQPIVTARSEVTPASIRRGHRRERWQRIAVSSAKQCGRAVVPAVLEPRAFEATTVSLADLTLPGPGLMFVEPSASADALGVGDLDAAPPRETSVLIGPEGGWTAEEIDRGSTTCRLVTLGSRTLRADAMAVVALTALFTFWREL